MKRQLRSGVPIILCGLFLSLGPWATLSAQKAVDCTQSAIQSSAPPNTKILSAIAQSDPVVYCDVLGC
jgi:hypothetical protein